MVDVLDFDHQEHIESVSDLFGPMVVQLEKYFAHHVHHQLIFGIGIEEIKIVVEYDQQPINTSEVLSLQYLPDDYEEVVVVESCWHLGGPLLSYHLQIFVHQL